MNSPASLPIPVSDSTPKRRKEDRPDWNESDYLKRILTGFYGEKGWPKCLDDLE